MQQRKNSARVYDILSANRSGLMGLAILWVVLFHSGAIWNFLPYRLLKSLGYGGVDIFLLLSGMGIFRSLEKNSIPQFFLNRAKKILPIWLCYLLFWYACGSLLFHDIFSAKQIIGAATFTGFWFNLQHHGNWYVHTIVLFYLLSPLIVLAYRKCKNRLTLHILLITAALLFSFLFINTEHLIAFSRLPVYILGIYLAANADSILLTPRRKIIYLCLFLFGLLMLSLGMFAYKDLLSTYGLYWYPFLLIALPLSLFLCLILQFVKKYLSFISQSLTYLGSISLEVLLMSDFAFRYFKGIHVGGAFLSSFIVLLIAVVMGILFHILIEQFKRLFAKRTANKVTK